MAIQTQVECDGCGAIVMLPPGTASDKIRLGVAISINCAADKKYDLCNPCQAHLAEITNPTTWLRQVSPV